MKQSSVLALILAAGLFLSPSVFAQNVPGGGPSVRLDKLSPKVQEAIKACVKSSSKDSKGRIDKSAMDTCLKGKGITQSDFPAPKK